MVTTHYMDEAEHCDTLAFIFAGRIIAMGTPEEVKRRAMSGDLLEIVTAHYARALDVLAARPDVRDAALFGRTIHVTVENPTRRPGAPAGARRPGGGGRPHRPVAPSLEDAFVSLVERLGGEADAPAAGGHP